MSAPEVCVCGRHYRGGDGRWHTERNGFDEACATMCGLKIDCGGSCCLDPGHEGWCECCGDEAGSPGTCPA